MEDLTCKFCGKDFSNLGGLHSHEKYFCNKNPNILINKRYTEHHKAPCKYCGKLYDVANLKRHEESKICLREPKNIYKLDHEDLFCKFCQSEFNSKNALIQHEIRCKLNPERKNYNSLGRWSTNTLKGQTKENNKYIKKQAETLKNKYQQGLIKPKQGKSFGFKSGWYKDIWCDSSWELAFLVYHLDHNINIKRSELYIPYIGKDHRLHYYFPDFEVEGKLYEIKGRVTDITSLKLESAREKGYDIILIGDKEIVPYLKYCKDTYGDDFYSLYNK